MILPEERDPRLVTIRRGGSLTDDDHRLLALWAVGCAEHVLHLFERARPDDPRPRQALDAARAWVRGELPMMRTRAAGGHAMGAARELAGAPRFAAYAAGQAAVVAHVPEHDLGAAAYAIRAARAAAPPAEADDAARAECRWQRAQLPDAVRDLVLDDQRRRNDICWGVFVCSGLRRRIRPADRPAWRTLALMENDGDGDPARERLLSDAFRQAVARERTAIAVHEHAAEMHDAVAERLEELAEVESDAGLVARRREDAAVERSRAEAARARAAAARRRLTEEGQS